MTIINLGYSITAAPQRVSPLTAIDVSTAVQECTANLPLSKKVQSVSNTVDLLLSPTLSGEHAGQRYYFAWDKYAKSVLYFVRFSNSVRLALPSGSSNHGVVTATRQVLVKRVAERHAATSGLAKEVFWKYIFPLNGVVCSDNQQTNDGEGFWAFVIKKAFEDGLYVYLTDTNMRTWEQIDGNESFVNGAASRAWGSPSFFQRMILVVSKHPL